METEIRTLDRKVFGLMVAVLFLLLVIIPGTSLASPCSSFDVDRAQHFADIAGRRIAVQNNGGQNMRTHVIACDLNSYSGDYRLDVRIEWGGAVFASRHYSTQGLLQMGSNGSNARYSETYANQQLRDWRAMMGLVMVMVVLGSLAEASN